MSLQKAILIEVFAVLLTVHRGIAMLSPDMYASPGSLHFGLLIGLLGLIYGLAGEAIGNSPQSE
ncbi:hypothetical protein [Natrinema limicola]|uniref:Uncharacterized protein n=1 Tax=Natrinema limicola JCM 13563 TaxID=1230457 RepID=M0BZY8_9EURY|nr:hypothetical protein [Natrinema limicola]ELZ16571.1 hypothetical protein C476_16937 [Natrinema limicola JCM 13563]